MGGAVILYTTWPDAETARSMGAEAVEQALAACANILAPMRSIYRWEGRLEDAAEVPMLLKTTAEGAAALKDFLVRRHPYALPCIVAFPVERANSHAPYLDWIDDCVTKHS